MIYVSTVLFILKQGCADVYCVTLNELQAHRDVFIHKVFSLFDLVFVVLFKGLLTM